MAFVNLPPNLQDMFYSITDRIAKLETGPNAAAYSAQSAQETAQSAQSSAQSADAKAANAGAQATAAAIAAGIAQAQATTALAAANTAYNAAINSLQPSASTIVNASNQMTAISTNGITVYSGSSSSSGARVVMNSLGLAGYNSSGSATFSISASTGAAVFSGSVTGSTITGGTLNIAGNAIIDSSGLLTATGATITGTINATAGYFGTSSNGFSINSTGMIGVGGGVISGGIITTSTGSNAVVLDGSNNALGIKYGGSYAGWLLGIGSGAFMMHYGTTPDIVSGYPRTSVSSTTASLAANASNSLSVTTSGNNMQGAMTFGSTVTVNSSLTGNSSATFGSGSLLFEFLSSSGNVRVAQTYNQAVSGRAMQISSAGLYGTTASTERKKHNINPYAINTNTLLQLEPVSFNYIESIDEEQNPEYGFIAEDADRLGLYELVGYDKEGLPDYFAYEKLPVFLLQLAKEQDARLKALEGK
jgi:hypothetical protein